MAIDGARVKLKVEGDVVGQQTALSKDNSRDLLDAFHKGTDFQKQIYGKQDQSISLDYLVEPNGATTPAKDAIEDAVNNKNKITVAIEENGTEIATAEALVESVEETYDDNETASASAEIQLNEPLT